MCVNTVNTNKKQQKMRSPETSSSASSGDDLLCIDSDEDCNSEMYEEDNENQQEIAPASSYLATKSLKYIAKANEENNAICCHIIENSFYVDDLIYSGADATVVKGAVDGVTNILNVTDNTTFTINLRDNESAKALGIKWTPQLKYKFSPNAGNSEVTKRSILSAISSLFEPLGIVQPIIREKILIQGLWQAKLQLSVELKHVKWRTNVKYLTPPICWYRPIPLTVIELGSPTSYFLKYFTEDILRTMSEKTNLYAVQNNIKFSSTNVSELNTFIGIHIMMGNLHYPGVRLYWTIECMRDLKTVEIKGDSTEVSDFALKCIEKSGRHYQATPAWKSKENAMRNNSFIGAHARAEKLRFKLLNLGKLTMYNEAMNELVINNFAEMLHEQEENSTDYTYYMPHTPVFKEDKHTTKLRIVFDASARSPTLNDT
ncbi:hypothetical protein ILUMI_18891 [Ignelater luminosus]|uniref:PiggyBac transposable element-derived protein domain-containing protein n=1 Tax=Ignelater luminosus TaxID=2038154 RepID=A0A8K0G639_IGNLU|nr:hypothetical protein ILUMI_18891 [Ignelater luminosus]